MYIKGTRQQLKDILHRIPSPASLVLEEVLRLLVIQPQAFLNGEFSEAEPQALRLSLGLGLEALQSLACVITTATCRELFALFCGELEAGIIDLRK